MCKRGRCPEPSDGFRRAPRRPGPRPGFSAPARPGRRGGGWTEVEIPIESVEAAVPEILKLGAEAEVLAPAELRAAVVRTLRTMHRTYGL
nr:WYL domain-containing protein [Amycolatopsis lexingtonensis]